MSGGTLAAEETTRSARAVRAEVTDRNPAAQPGLPMRPSRMRQLPCGLLGMVGLIIAIEAAISHAGSIDVCRSHLELSWRNSRQAVSRLDAQADILCFGDSMVKLGVLPRVIEDCLNLSAYNLAVLAGQPASSCFLLRQVLESGHRPRAVIVDFTPPLITMPLQANIDGWAELADCRDAIELTIEAGDPALGIAIASKWLVPSQSRHGILRSSLAVGHDRALEERGLAENRVFERNWKQNRGAQVAPLQFIPIEGALPEPPRLEDYRWQPRAVHTAYVARFLSLARSHAIPVFWVLPPLAPSRRARSEAGGIRAAYQSFVWSFLADYPGVTILDGQDLDWDTWAFRDPIHLNRDGAVAFSLAVADVLARRLGSPNAGKTPASKTSEARHRVDRAGLQRWVVLIAPAESATWRWERALEDLDQSRRALGRGSRFANT